MTVWREPKQARSRQRFEHILDVTAGLISQHGLPALTTNHIAGAAGVSVGSLYEFFPNKEAVLAALVARYLGELGAVFTLADEDDFPAAVHRMAGGLVAFTTTRADFAHLMSDEVSGAMQAQVLAGIRGVLGRHYPTMTEEQAARCAWVGFTSVGGMLTFGGALTPAQLHEEITRVVVGYVAEFVRREGGV